MPTLQDTETLAQLRRAFTAEAEDRLRFTHFARQAEIEGRPELGAALRDAAGAAERAGLAHLDWLVRVGDPATGRPVRSATDVLQAAIESDRGRGNEGYAQMAETARAEGLAEVAEWLEAAGRARDARLSALRDFVTPGDRATEA